MSTANCGPHTCRGQLAAQACVFINALAAIARGMYPWIVGHKVGEGHAAVGGLAQVGDDACMHTQPPGCW